jgi:hypothetical protein
MLRSVSVPSTLSRRPGPLAAGLLLLLALAGGRPACAMSGTINSAYTGDYPIVVGDGETLNIADGAQISGGFGVPAVKALGGTLNITGGSISGYVGVEAVDGTVNITGGSISGAPGGVDVEGGMVNISGGSISGGPYGVGRIAGTLIISGCLRLQNNTLKGTLADGHSINTLTFGLTTGNLQNLRSRKRTSSRFVSYVAPAKRGRRV